jgi:hypothetical protein
MQALGPKVFIQVQCDLAVRTCAQPMSGSLELALGLLVAVELAIDDDSSASILAGDGLTAGDEIDDAQPGMSESNAPVVGHPVALSVRTPME